MYCIIKCTVQEKQARVKNADLPSVLHSCNVKTQICVTRPQCVKSPIRVYSWRPCEHCSNHHTIFMRFRTMLQFTFKACIFWSSRTHWLLNKCYYRSLRQDVTSNNQIILFFGLLEGLRVMTVKIALLRHVTPGVCTDRSKKFTASSSEILVNSYQQTRCHASYDINHKCFSCVW